MGRRKYKKHQEPTLLTKKHLVMWLVAVLVVFVVAQLFTIYFIVVKSDEMAKDLKNLESELEEEINLNKAETQGQINLLIEEVSSVSTAQSGLEEELSEIKATASADFSGIIENVIKGVVTIKTDISQGSGFIVTDDGYVVTNHHVMRGAKSAGIYTYDDKTYSVRIIDYNQDMDLALLKISGSFDELEFGDSDDMKIGEKVIAIGNPLGLSFTATEGIISGLHREGINNLPYYFQTDVSLNPGNSGGPLINTKGKVIGINNFVVSGAENLGFALESNKIVEVINEISMSALNVTLIR